MKPMDVNRDFPLCNRREGFYEGVVSIEG